VPVFYVGYHNPWRIEDFMSEFRSGRPKPSIAILAYSPTRHEERLFMVFLYQKGWLADYIRMVKKQDIKKFNLADVSIIANNFESVIEKEWGAYIDATILEASSPSSDLYRIPPSIILDDFDSWNVWKRSNGLFLTKK